MKDAVSSIQSVVVFGGTSEIAVETVRHLQPPRRRTIRLLVRDAARGEEAAAALRAEGHEVSVQTFEADDLASHSGVVEDAFAGGDVDLVLYAVGVLGDQSHDETDPARAAAVAHTNYVAAVSLLLQVAQRLQAQRHGTIAVLSSVAGVRARRANFIYGSSKAGLDAFSQGLSYMLEESNVRVLVVRPGFVHTAMTRGRPAPPLAIDAAAAGRYVAEAIAGRAHIAWVPPRIRWLMRVMRALPRPVFRRIKT